MKRNKLLCLVISAIMMLSTFVVCGCEVTSKEQVSNTDNTSSNVVETEPTKYDMSGVSFKGATVVYDGQVHSLAISGTLPEGVSVSYLGNGKKEIGSHIVTARFTGSGNYEPIEDMYAELKIVEKSENNNSTTVELLDYDMSNVSFNDGTFEYDGKSKSLTISGVLPEGVSVRYEGNGRIDEGEYQIKAIFTGNSLTHNPIPSMTAVLKITRENSLKTYDMSGIKFENKSVAYDGKAHSIEIIGTLPAGVTVSYAGNGKTAVGTYTVTANFKGASDYNAIPSMTATLTISSSVETISKSEFTFADAEYEYDGNAKSLTAVYPTSKATVEYVNNAKTKVGVYEVTATFTAKDGYAFEGGALTYSMTATLTINEQDVKPTKNMVYVDASSKSWSKAYCYMWSSTTVNNGAWPGQLMTDEGNGIFSYEYDDSMSNIIFNNGNSGSGNQTDDLILPGNNYIYSLSSNKWAEYGDGNALPKYDMSGVSFKSVTVTYDGEAHSIEITGKLPDGVTVSYTGNGQTEVGTYTVTANFTGSSDYQAIAPMTATLKIKTEMVDTDSYYTTNTVGYGVNKTMSIDGSLADWDSSMLIAQGLANDDPRVYRPNSMYEIPIDLYALYAAYDDTNLYLMFEFTNVQDIVAPNDTYPISQGNINKCNLNCPFIFSFNTGAEFTSNGSIGTGTRWDTGITWDMEGGIDTQVIWSYEFSNGPFIYTCKEAGFETEADFARTETGITGKSGTGILSDTIYGINGAYGEYNGRVVGDTFDTSTGDWVEFNELGHDSDALDFFFEISIPLAKLGVTKSYIQTNGIGISLVATMGKSGMDCLPYDFAMQDNANLPDTESQENNSYEKSDLDSITAKLARIGK